MQYFLKDNGFQDQVLRKKSVNLQGHAGSWSRVLVVDYSSFNKVHLVVDVVD